LEVRISLRFADAKQPWPAFATALPLGFLHAQTDAATATVVPPIPTPTLPAPSLPSQGGGK
jgi:hypothetical protein